MEAHRDGTEPVFLMVGLKAPHLQFEYPARYETAFDGVGIPRPDTYDEDFSVSGKLQAVKDWLGMDEFHCGLNCFGDSWDRHIKSHYRAVLSLDDSVGTLRRAVSQRGKDDNTLFIYTSDNGYSLGDHGLTENHMVYDEPVRVPFLVDFPGWQDRGLRLDGLVSTMDIAPTALDYARVEPPPTMTGRSLKPLGDAGRTPRPADRAERVVAARTTRCHPRTPTDRSCQSAARRRDHARGAALRRRGRARARARHGDRRRHARAAARHGPDAGCGASRP